MARWDGTITEGDLKMDAVVYYTVPSVNFSGEWSGNGTSITEWAFDGNHNTNIGELFFTKCSVLGDGNYYYEFMGTGIPSGPLADKIGIK